MSVVLDSTLPVGGSGVKTVLVVDDEEHIRDLVRVVLEGRDCRVLAADDGASGLTLAATVRPDLMLLDSRIPAHPGSEVLSELRADTRTALIPVILMSGIKDCQTEEAERLAEADGCLLKPFRPVQLLEEIQHVLRADTTGQSPCSAAIENIGSQTPEDQAACSMERRTS